VDPEDHGRYRTCLKDLLGAGRGKKASCPVTKRLHSLSSLSSTETRHRAEIEKILKRASKQAISTDPSNRSSSHGKGLLKRGRQATRGTHQGHERLEGPSPQVQVELGTGVATRRLGNVPPNLMGTADRGQRKTAKPDQNPGQHASRGEKLERPRSKPTSSVPQPCRSRPSTTVNSPTSNSQLNMAYSLITLETTPPKK